MAHRDDKPLKVSRLGHVAISSPDPAALASFYRDTLGMSIIGAAADGSSVFLSARPEEESHELVIFRDPVERHVALKVDTLTQLQEFYRSLRSQRVPVLATTNHGVSLSIYCLDADGNMTEIYWTTGREYPQPFSEPVDLESSEETLLDTISRLPAPDPAST